MAGELQLLVDAGMPVRDALTAATDGALGGSDGLLGPFGDELHVPGIAVGHNAGIVVLDRDPRIDLSALREPWMVIHRGRVIEHGAGRAPKV